MDSFSAMMHGFRSLTGYCRLSALTRVLRLFVTAGAEAQPNTTRWTPQLSMQYDQITAVDISPDGKHIAYVVQETITGIWRPVQPRRFPCP